MVARSHTIDDDVEDLFDPSLEPDRIPGVHLVTSIEEAQAIFDQWVQHELGITGDEFLLRWEAGEYGSLAEIPDTPEGWRIRRLVDMIPFAQTPFP